MKYNFALSMILPFSICISVYGFLDVTQQGHEQYQYIVINGKIVSNKPPTNGQQPEKRYEIIEKILKMYKRPFTMLDIGAAQGYHSLKAAWEYPKSSFVMIEGNNHAYPRAGDQLLSICKENDKLKNIIHLNKLVVLNDLVRLGECEHFDVVLALNILHWLDKDWRKALDAILTLGDNIIIETPRTRPEIIEYLYQSGAQLIGEVPRHAGPHKTSPVFLIESSKSKVLSRSTWVNPKGSYEVISNFSEKKLKKWDKGKELMTPWLPGINIITFKMYQGSYPLAQTLKNEVTRLKDEEHNDWNPNNFIIQGNILTMIDYNTSYFNNHPTKPVTYNRYRAMLQFLDAKTPAEAERLFWKVTASTRDEEIGED